MSTYSEELLDETGGRVRGQYGDLVEEEKQQPGWGSSFTVGEGLGDIDLSDKPVIMSKGFAREFYWNGPSYNAWDHHQVEMNQIQAVVDNYSDPRKKATLDSFQNLLSRYGHTNSPGVLWAMAQSGLNPDSPALQGLLKQDAKASQADYSSLAPTTASAVTPEEVEDEGTMWAPAQWLTRNAFAALSMPVEAVQGSVRQVGGAFAEAAGNLTPESALGAARTAVASGLSLSPILAPFVDGVLVPDEEFQNPWEQTYGGQTLLAAARNPENLLNPFNPAYGTQQAGIDTQAAEKLLQDDPRYSEQRQIVMDDPSQLNSVVTRIAEENELYGGPGWFIEETSEVGKQQVKATFDAWTIPGPDDSREAWTLGRGIIGALAGPDWSGYSTASGLIDAVALIAGDPTVIGSKFNVLGKTIRGAGMLASAAGEAKRAGDVVAGLQYVTDAGRTLGRAERALTFGREAKKVRSATAAMNRNVNKFVADYNKLAAQPGGPLEGKTLTAADFESMPKTDQAEAVRQMREAQLAKEAYDSAMPSVTGVAQYAAGERVAQARLNIFTNGRDVVGSDLDRLEKTVSLWDQYEEAATLARPKNGSVYSPVKMQRWFDSLDPEDQDILLESAAHVNKLLKRKKIDVENDPLIAEKIFSKAREYYGKKLDSATKQQELFFADQVDEQAARLILSNQAERAVNELENINYVGVIVPDQIDPENLTAMQRGLYNGNDVIMGWKQNEVPVYKNAGDKITEEEAAVLASFIDEIAQREGAIFEPFGLSPEELDALPGTIAKQIESIENPFEYLKELVSKQDTTYAGVLDAMQQRGLGYEFGEFVTNQGWDALWGVNRRYGNGAWFPETSLTEIYKFPDSALQNAEQAAGMLDDMDAFLAALPRTAEPVGLFSMSREQIDDLILDSERALTAARNTRTTKRNTALQMARAGQQRIEAGRVSLAEKFSDPELALREIVGYEMGLALSGAKGATVTPDNVRWFMFGSGPLASVRAKALDALSSFVSEKDIVKLQTLARDSKEWADIAAPYVGSLRQVTSNKWDSETYMAVLDNAINGGGQDGLIRVLAPRLGVDVEKGSIQAGLKKSSNDGLRSLTTWRTSDAKIKRAIARQMGERPGARLVQLDKSGDVVDAVIKYGMYAKIAPSKLNEYIGRVTLNDGTFGATAANVDVLKSLFNDINDSLVARLDKSSALFKGTAGAERMAVLKAALRDSTRLFLGGETDARAGIAERIGSGDTPLKYLGDDGASVDIPDIMFDSELASGYLSLPNVDDWQQGISRVGAALSRLPAVENLYDFSRRVFDNFFRTGLLIFRGAYILRNSAEMQVRLFLNGHHSIFNDPLSMVGIVLGNPKVMGKYTPKGKFFDQSFGKYQQTILGTDFEVGLDEAAAIANHVEEFFALTRQANALTDPRVYQYGIRKGWQKIGLEAAQFPAGWANELITLHRTVLARAVLGDIPLSARAGRGEQISDARAVVNWVLSSDENAVKARQQLIAADEKYAQIFNSPSLTEDYLFNSPNSVLARVRQFTMDDPVLTGFIKTGKWMDGPDSFSLNSVPNLKDRVKGLQSLLRKRFWENGQPSSMVVDRMGNGKVMVPWIDGTELKKGRGWIDGFFAFANKIERLGTVGPEFRMAYWDRMAQILPGLSAEYVDDAMKAAETTLSSIQKIQGGKFVNVGSKHPAWKALDKAKKDNSGGMLTLQEAHDIAMDYAAQEVKGLFYDAARRNNFWAATRLIFPFGQAWGNTVTEWSKLAAKNPIRVYEAQRAFNAAMMPGSAELYDLGSAAGLYGDYEEGYAPWDQDPNGGFFFQNQFGDYDFVMPLAGRMQGFASGSLAWAQGLGFNSPALDVSSPISSANLALGGAEDNPIAGVSPLVGMGINLLPDEDVIENLQAMSQPFGPQTVLENIVPAWAQGAIAGVGAIPIVGEAIGPAISSLAPSRKNKEVVEAVSILASSGRYDLTDPVSVAALKEDATALGNSFLFISGLGQNISPTSPRPQYSVTGETIDLPVSQQEALKDSEIGLGVFSRLYPLYLTENGGDSVAAKEDMLKDFGPAVVFALTMNRKGWSRVPSSEARQWARATDENKEIAGAYPDEFSLFFPEGDPRDATARAWIESITQEERGFRSSEDVVNDVISMLLRVERQGLEAMYNADKINKPTYEAAISDLKEKYKDTNAGVEFNSQTATQRLERIKGMYDRSQSIQQTENGRTFAQAWAYRDSALGAARTQTGQPDTTLGGKGVAAIKAAYIDDLNDLLLQNPNFKVLHNMMIKEWD
jgi:hypothetical protein